MHRFYLPFREGQNGPLVLTGREAHHATRVLRLRRGDEVIILDGAGSEYSCTIEEAGKDRVELAVLKRNQIHGSPHQITLLQAVPKGKIIESIIQKAVELGIHRIVPLLTERVTTRLEGASAAHKAEKLQQVAIEAIKQCGSPWLPRIEIPMTPGEFLSRHEVFDLPLIASLQPGSRNVREHFRAYQGEFGRLPRTVCIWIGPEGDFTADETHAVQESGARPITLGRLVLRVETAAICSLAILNHELQS